LGTKIWFLFFGFIVTFFVLDVKLVRRLVVLVRDVVLLFEKVEPLNVAVKLVRLGLFLAGLLLDLLLKLLVEL